MTAAGILLASIAITAVAEIAREVGIDDPKYFSRLFARHVGVSPTRFRRRGGW